MEIETEMLTLNGITYRVLSVKAVPGFSGREVFKIKRLKGHKIYDVVRYAGGHFSSVVG